MKYILWDWNGTLLDDVDACINSMNVLLARRSIAAIDKASYIRLFIFPVVEYYKRLGFNFDKDSFEQLSMEFVTEYKKFSVTSRLYPGAEAVLEQLKHLNYTQTVISAMQQSGLIEQISSNNISGYFKDIVGLKDIYAASKVTNALNYIKDQNIDIQNVTFIGDTYHDYEVSKAIGCKCILISNGHQIIDSDMAPESHIFTNISEVLDVFESLSISKR